MARTVNDKGFKLIGLDDDVSTTQKRTLVQRKDGLWGDSGNPVNYFQDEEYLARVLWTKCQNEYTQSAPQIENIVYPLFWASFLGLWQDESNVEYSSQGLSPHKVVGDETLFWNNNPINKKERDYWLMALKGGGPFTDRFGNTIFFRMVKYNDFSKSDGSPYANYLMENGYLGTSVKSNPEGVDIPDAFTLENAGQWIYRYKDHSEMQDVKNRWIQHYASKDWEHAGFNKIEGSGWKPNKLYKPHIKEAFLNKKAPSIGEILLARIKCGITRRVNTPIIINIARSRDGVVSVANYLSLIVAGIDVGLSVIGVPAKISNFVGTFSKMALQDPQNFISNFLSTPDNITMAVNAIAGENSSIAKHAQTATSLYTAHQKGSGELAKMLTGTADQWVGDKIESYLQTYDIPNVLKAMPAGANPEAVNNLVMAFNETMLFKEFSWGTSGKEDTLTLGGTDENKPFSSQPTMRHFLFNMLGDGFLGSLPAVGDVPDGNRESGGGGNHPYAMILKRAWSEVSGDPNKHWAFVQLAYNMPVKTTAFDELAYESLEEMLRNNKEKQVYLPTTIPVDQRECWTRELKANGYTVLDPNLQTKRKEADDKARKLDRIRNYFVKRGY